MSKDGVINIHHSRIYFTKVIRADKNNIRVLLKSGHALQVPRKKVVRLPEGTVI